MNNSLKDREFLYDLYISQNKSRKEICEYLSCSENTLKFYLKKFDIKKEKSKIYENIAQSTYAKYGHNSFFSSSEFQQKASKTWKQKYGVDNPSKSKQIRKKQQDSLNRHLRECPNFKDEIKEKKINTNLQKYGKEFFILTDEYKNYYKNEEWLQSKRLKEVTTKLNNKSFGKSREEDNIFEMLKKKYIDVKRQYTSDLYPFECDFYIPSLDLYIEYQGFWMHGSEPFRGTELQLEIINKWKNKNTIQYERAINTWTIRDPLKRKTAEENKINYLEFFNIEDLINWINT